MSRSRCCVTTIINIYIHMWWILTCLHYHLSVNLQFWRKHQMWHQTSYKGKWIVPIENNLIWVSKKAMNSQCPCIHQLTKSKILKVSSDTKDKIIKSLPVLITVVSQCFFQLGTYSGSIFKELSNAILVAQRPVFPLKRT